MKLIKINKDAIFYPTVGLYALSNTFSFIYGGDFALMCSNVAFILLFVILIILKKSIPRFNDWLNKDFQ